MYRHIASSIKEDPSKLFVNQSEKDKWNAKSEVIHEHDTRYYNRDEMDLRLGEIYKTVEGENILTESVSGFTKDLEILGNTKQRTEKIKIVPVFTGGSINDTTGEEFGSGDPDSEGIANIRTDYISVQYGDVLEYTNNGERRSYYIYFYDKDKNFIEYFLNESRPKLTIEHYDVAYVRIRHWDHNSENIVLTITRTHLDDLIHVGEKIGEDKYSFNILSRGRNLAKPCRLMATTLQEPHIVEEHRYAMEELIEVKPNTKYTFSTEIATQTKYCIWLDEYKEVISRSGVGSNIVAFYTTSPANAKYVQLYVYSKVRPLDRETEMVNNMWTFVEVEKHGSSILEPYTEFVQTIELPVQLYGFDGMSDRLYCENNRLYLEKRIKQLTLTGDDVKEGWTVLNGQCNEITTHVQTDAYKLNDVYGTNGKTSGIRCNMIMSIGADFIWYQHETNEGIGQNARGNIQIRIKNRRLNGQTINEYLKQMHTNGTPCIIHYATTKPEIIDLGPISDYFNLKTMKSYTGISSRNSNVKPIIRCKVPNAISSAISTNVNKLDELRSELNSINDIVESGNTSIKFKNGAYSINDSVKGTYIDDLKIGGQTLVNILSKDIVSQQYSIQEYTANGDWVVKHDTDLSRYKPNTTYTSIVYVEENTLVMENNDNTKDAFGIGRTVEACCFNEGYYFKAKDLKNVHVRLLTTKEDFTDCTYGLRNQITPMCVSGKLKVRQVLIEGDHRDLMIPFFEGMKSVNKNIEIKSVGENIIIDGDENILTSQAWSRTYPLKVEVKEGKIYRKSTTVNAEYWVQYVTLKPNTTYETNAVVSDISPGLYDEKNIWRYPRISDPSGTTDGTVIIRFTTGSSTKYAVFLYGGLVTENARVYDRHMFIREIKSINEEHGSYTKPESNKYNITLSEPLRSLPHGVKDTIEKVNGEYCIIRRCGEYVMTSNDTWKIVIDEYQPADKTLIAFNNFSTRNKVKNKQLDKYKAEFYCDMLTPIGYNSSMTEYTVKFHEVDDNFRIAIKRSELTTEDDDGLRNWLMNKEIKVVYELKDHVIEPLGQDITIGLFDNNTTIGVNVDIVPPVIEGVTSTRLTNTVKTMINKLSYIENLDNTINKVKLRSMYELYKTSFGIDIMSARNDNMYIDSSEDVFRLLYSVINEGPYNYDRNVIEEQIDLFTLLSIIDFDMSEYLLNTIESQHSNEDYCDSVE